MLPEELLQLRQEMYVAHRGYLKAWAEYAALRLDSPQETMQQRTDRCLLTAGRWNVALAALIEYLEATQADVDRAVELRRARHLQALLQHEVRLILQGLTRRTL